MFTNFRAFGLVMLSLAFAIVSGCDTSIVEEQHDNGFVIRGDIKGVADQKIYLKPRVSGDMAVQAFDAVDIVDGKFEFKGRVANPPLILSIEFEQPSVKFWQSLIIENSEMVLSLWVDSEEGGNITLANQFKGSQSHEEYAEFMAHQEMLRGQTRDFARIYRTLGDNGRLPMEQWSAEDLAKVKEMEALSEESDRKTREYLLEQANGESALKSIFAHGDLFHWGVKSMDECLAAFEQLPSVLKSSHLVAWQSAEIARKEAFARAQKAAAVGKKIEDFSQADQHGNPIKASDLLQPGRYLLLDFWASWCGPCRAENPNLLKAYNHYHDKGFDVLGISLDDDRDAWLEAIEEDSLPWPQVSDLNGTDNAVAQQFGVSGIPSSFLLNDQGEILYKDLTGDELHARLKAIFSD